MNLSKIVRKKIYCSAVVVAAGSGTRFGCDKMFVPLSGVPVLAYSLATLENCSYITEIIVVSELNKITDVAELCKQYKINKVSKIVCGGATRLESALSGISEVNDNSNLIAIHDGARPLVTKSIVESTIEAAFKFKAAIPGVSTKDTVKVAYNSFVSETPDRSSVFGVQTPQVFIPELIKGALTDALQKNIEIFDDASAVEALGFPVYISEGSEENIKITTPLDLRIAETILTARRERVPK